MIIHYCPANDPTIQWPELTNKKNIIYIDNDIFIYMWGLPPVSEERTYISKKNGHSYYRDLFYFKGHYTNITREEAMTYIAFI